MGKATATGYLFLVAFCRLFFLRLSRSLIFVMIFIFLRSEVRFFPKKINISYSFCLRTKTILFFDVARLAWNKRHYEQALSPRACRWSSVFAGEQCQTRFSWVKIKII